MSTMLLVYVFIAYELKKNEKCFSIKIGVHILEWVYLDKSKTENIWNFETILISGIEFI